MKCYYITFRSVTFAQRAEKLLNQRGHRVSLMRTPRWMEEQGCGYCLRLRREEMDSVLAILRNANVQFRKVYYQTADGNVVEL